MKNLFIGTMGWSYGFWKRSFYPEDLAAKDFLAFYSKRLGSVEVDSTFYRIPRTLTLTDWKQKTPQSFRFSLKFPKIITHIKMLKNCQQETQVFLERAEILEEKLGVLLIQLPPTFGLQNLQILLEYIDALPRANRYAIEVRNKSLLTDTLYTLLKKHNVAFVWSDTALMPPVTEKTAGFLYVRWIGDRKAVNGTKGKVEKDRTTDIQEWAKRILIYLEKKTPIFGYFSKYYSGFPIVDAEEFLKQSMEGLIVKKT